jgi:type III secretion protein L
VFEEMLSAQDLLSNAQQHADAIKRAARAEIDAFKHKAYLEACESARNDVAAAMTATTAHMEAAFVGLEARIANTVLQALQQILGEMTDSKVMSHLIRRVLAQSRSYKSLRLRVAAADFEIVKNELADILRDFRDVEFIDILKDTQRPKGTCVLETEHGAIDASLNVQLAAIKRSLVDAFVGKREQATQVVR